MSKNEIAFIISVFRDTICNISKEEAETVVELCKRKISISGQSEDYMWLLLPNELKNYCFRKTVNSAKGGITKWQTAQTQSRLLHQQ